MSRRAMGVLQRLAAEAGKVVSRRELARSRRPPLSSPTLNRTISELRSALGDHFDDPRHIRTVPRRGYQLLTEPGALTEEERAAGAHSATSFWDELKRRSVFRVGAGYAAVAWLIIEVSDIILPQLGFPDWVLTWIIVLAMVGLPVALVLAWVFEITAGGVILDPRGHDMPALKSRLVIDGLIGLSLAAVAAIYFIDPWKQEIEPDWAPPPPSIPENSVAVLPFTNIEQDPDTDAFAFGLAEELLTALSRIRELKVTSRTASFYYGEKEIAPEVIGETLRVKHLVEGSVQKRGERVLVSVQLIDAHDNYHLWSETFDRQVTDLLDLRMQLADTVARRLSEALSVESQERLAEVPTEDSDAFLFFLRGQDYLRRPYSEDNSRAAESLLEKAVERDPQFVGAHASLCETYLERYSYTMDPQWFEAAEKRCYRALTFDDARADVIEILGRLYAQSSQFEKSLEHFRRTISLDPSSASAHFRLAYAQERLGRLEDAERNYRTAIELEPGYWKPYRQYGLYLLRHGRTREAIQLFKRVTEMTPDSAVAHATLAAGYANGDEWELAQESWDRSLAIDPTSNVYLNTANLSYYLGDFQEAARRYRMAAELAPNDYKAWGGFAESLRFVDGRDKERTEAYARALELAQERLQINPADWRAIVSMATFHASLGNENEALELTRQALEIAPEIPTVHFHAALVFARIGVVDRSMDHLETAADLGFSSRLIRLDPDFRAFRENRRFADIVSREEQSDEQPTQS